MIRRSTATRLIAAAALCTLTSACSVSTAHIGNLKVGKTSQLTTQSTTFAPQDTIYAAGDASNIPDNVKMQWQIVAVDVSGQPKNSPIPSLDKSFEMSQDGTATYNLSPPPAGWPTGTYKIVVTMMEDGKQKDQKTQEITVSGT